MTNIRLRRAARRFLHFGLLLTACCLPLLAETTLSAAAAALRLWWQAVVPALLPFFLLSNLLVLSGAGRELGRWLTPLMEPLFALPGPAALAVAMGFCAGFPAGAAITATLFNDGLLTREEAQRLLAFTNNASPLFICGVIGVGLLACPRAGLLLAAVHYGTDLLLGLALGQLARLRGRRQRPVSPPPANGSGELFPLKAAAQQAAANIVLIGCLMVLFSVLAALLTAPLRDSSAAVAALCRSLLEMTIGVNAWADMRLPWELLLPLLGAVLGFGGLSVQAQVCALVAGLPLSPRLYVLCRPMQALLSALALALLTPRCTLTQAAWTGATADGWPILLLSCVAALALTLGLALLSGLCRLAQSRPGRNI